VSTNGRLYGLLPAVYRLRDAELGGPLEALLGVMETQLQLVEQNIEDLYESWFIETAPGWVIPYIGALVGNRPLVEVTHSQRTDVAKTLYYRRRKGTLPMLEELARDVTGWGAHAVEFMELLAWTQNVNHVRRTTSPNPELTHPHAVDRVGTINLRNADALDRLDGPFDLAAHTVDVRRARAGVYRPAVKPAARQEEGWYGTRRIGFFLWRLGSYPIGFAGGGDITEMVAARRADSPNDHGWHYHPIGAPVPLFTNTQVERDPARLAREIHVPGPIRPIAFRDDLEAYRTHFLPLPPNQRPADAEWYGPNRSIHVVVDGVPVLPERVVCKNLSAWARPLAGTVAVDVHRGRLSFPAGEEPTDVHVAFAYGFGADIGAGPYDRRASLAEYLTETRARTRGANPWIETIREDMPANTLQDALDLWETAGKPPGIIEIDDHGVYGGTIDIELPEDGWLVIQAANGRMPSIRLAGDMHIAAPNGGQLTLDGLLIEGGLELDGPVTIDVAHCTLVPGRILTDDGDPQFPDGDSILVAPGGGQRPEVTLRSCIAGAIRLPASTRHLVIRDAIVQAFVAGGVERPAIAATDPADAPGPTTTIERATLFGEVHVRELVLASEVLFTSTVVAQRRQSGCVRFSHVPAGSQTPRRFQCQPDLALEDVTDPVEQARIQSRMAPIFVSTRFSDPAYAQLRLDAALEIRTGAANGSEMGAFSSRMNPQREANLLTRLDEYLPFGLEAVLHYVT
jgi:hypothetical protein